MDQSNAQDGQQAQQDKKQEGDAENDILSMESLLEQEDFALDLPKRGEIREGMIASISDNEILVSIGAKSEGVISSRELEKMAPEEREKVRVGETVPVYIVDPENRQGGVKLSLIKAVEEDDWKQAEELLKSGELYEGAVAGYNKGGLIVNLGHLRGFVPASQISMSRRMSYQGDTPEQKWGEMVGETLISRVIEVDRQRGRLILSEKAASQESRETLKERLLEELEEGEVRTGRVTSLAKFGAFVNINGADGLVHLSELSWERIEDPKEVLEVGQEVKVKVITVDKERRRIGLSLRQLQHDPWVDRVAAYKVGHLVEGTITRLTKFGAFARIDDDLEGLIHISELSEQRVEHPKEVLNEGDQITLRIIKIDETRRRIGLSLRKVSSGAYSDVDWEMTLAEIDQIADQENDSDEVDPRMAEGLAELAAAADEAANELGDSTEAETQPESPADEEPAAELEEASPAEEEAPQEEAAAEDTVSDEEEPAAESSIEASDDEEEPPAPAEEPAEDEE